MRLYLHDGFYVPIVISNPLSGKKYPEKGEILALIDTGFDGFLIIPEDIFNSLDALATHEATITGICCRVKAKISPIRIVIKDLNLSIDGECLTYEEAKEIILGIEALYKIRITFNGCRKEGKIERCGVRNQ